MTYNSRIPSCGPCGFHAPVGVERLKSGPMSVGYLAQGMGVSRPAVSQHLKILKEAGLVREHREGRKRIYEIDPEGLAALRRWLDQF